MTEMTTTRLLTGAVLIAALTAGCTPSRKPSGQNLPPVRDGTQAQQPQPRQQAQTPATQGGIRDYGDYQTAVALPGDTVNSLAERLNLSGIELGAYNGLAPRDQLTNGQELVLPPRPEGYATQTAKAPQPTSDPVPQLPAQTAPEPRIEATPLDGGTEIAEAPAPETSDSDWSPELAEAAIDRATGLSNDGQLQAPPSANSPIPENPPAPEELASPGLSQYQTRPAKRPEATPEPVEALEEGTDVTDARVPEPVPAPAAEPPAPVVAEPAATPVQKTRLQRPVEGPIALGFQRGSGRARNDGVDFATAPGAPVVAADDGEVALVSQSLGGLGTIVLLRHGGDLLTVYGRIDNVSLAKGALVKRGEQIGTVANPPSGSEARMHFEVRRGAESLDPRLFIAG